MTIVKIALLAVAVYVTWLAATHGYPASGNIKTTQETCQGGVTYLETRRGGITAAYNTDGSIRTCQ
ncbi:hypothetical protein [Methylovulum miyakonense]|uniref:hypothetical protein n=1 Tax=Methylovulum miyakonense TaxID=645578 RepID=UPI000378EFED|nr:hypothetical protein [Methylovulum miyakonense]